MPRRGLGERRWTPIIHLSLVLYPPPPPPPLSKPLGRFATIPYEEIVLAAAGSLSASEVNALGFLRTLRLLRLGRWVGVLEDRGPSQPSPLALCVLGHLAAARVPKGWCAQGPHQSIIL